ncbi:nitroreductase family protein [Oceanimonas sp. CHS3-5]|uniref:nitroreductase family protein n=1 Tax=Oceanimonas sp. CHS3-5 TaxID=3068186 RepID=UPI00273F98C3|nr:nitroreductase family protein [Oceanimonas sp. CHS3-5]MDP5291627.1 nitroreductase family protein [Oceanimonas sp. CHS3-5]
MDEEVRKKNVTPLSSPLSKGIYNPCEIFFLTLANKSRFFSSLYCLISDEFSNEYQAVLKGCQAYHESLNNIGVTCSLLRRNTHRLEKGLIMKPRRSVFAESFIKETVICYKDAIASKNLDKSEKKWATDVLDEYFKVVGDTKVILDARQVYKKVRNNINADLKNESITPAVESSFKPYLYKELKKIKIGFDELENLFLHRRSVRWYKEQHVPKELVQKAANIASLAPSACNRQSYRFVFCNNTQKAVEIAKCAGGTMGFAENLPAIITIVGDLSAYPFERDRHLIYIDGSLGAMQLMLALETLGLSSCSINWPDVQANERKIRQIIELEDYERVVMLLAVGYADIYGGIPFSQKKIDEQILVDIS